jgi:ribonuclease HII
MTDGLFPADDERDLLFFERRARAEGYRSVAGVDEAGRGPLAGPVVAAAVILPPDVDLPGVNDSKQLSAARREELFSIIMAKAVSVGVGISSHDIIDSINILQASLTAMKKALSKLSPRPDFVLVDGTFKVPVRLPQRAIVKGDSLSLSVAAASIIAKVTRDRMMCKLDLRYPGYGFADHKGYACRSHLTAIASLGPSPVHRKSFSGVKEHLVGATETFPSLFPGNQ